MAELLIAAAGSAIGSAAFSGTALAAYGASIGWLAGPCIGQTCHRAGPPAEPVSAAEIHAPTSIEPHDDSESTH